MALITVCDKCGASHNSLDGTVRVEAGQERPKILVVKMRIFDIMYDICTRCRDEITRGLTGKGTKCETQPVFRGVTV